MEPGALCRAGEQSMLPIHGSGQEASGIISMPMALWRPDGSTQMEAGTI